MLVIMSVLFLFTYSNSNCKAVFMNMIRVTKAVQYYSAPEHYARKTAKKAHYFHVIASLQPLFSISDGIFVLPTFPNSNYLFIVNRGPVCSVHIELCCLGN